MTAPYTSVLWDVVRDQAQALRLDLAVISLLLLLLVEYDLVRVYGSRRRMAALGPIALVIVPLVVVFAVVVARRWWELRPP